MTSFLSCVKHIHYALRHSRATFLSLPMFAKCGVLYKSWRLLYGRWPIHLFILLNIVNRDFLNSNAFEQNQSVVVSRRKCVHNFLVSARLIGNIVETKLFKGLNCCLC